MRHHYDLASASFAPAGSPEAAVRVVNDSVPLPADAGRKAHVLLVEDDGHVAALTSEILDRIGFKVTHVASAAAALEALALGLPIDVVFPTS